MKKEGVEELLRWMLVIPQISILYSFSLLPRVTNTRFIRESDGINSSGHSAVLLHNQQCLFYLLLLHDPKKAPLSVLVANSLRLPIQSLRIYCAFHTSLNQSESPHEDSRNPFGEESLQMKGDATKGKMQKED